MRTKGIFLATCMFLISIGIAAAPGLIVDNTQPVVLAITPTTASPNYTNQTAANVRIVFNYTEANPVNFTLNVSNATTTICSYLNSSGLVGGTNVTVTTNCTLASGIQEGTFNLIINFTDIVGNFSTNTQTSSIVFDQTPPTLSGPIPANNSNVTDSEITLGINTSEVATCKFANSPDVDYNSMPYTFGNTHSITHTSVIVPTDFGRYNFYIRCRDNAGNANTHDFWTSFNYLSNTTVFGRSVTMNLAFEIGSDKNTDTIQASSNYSISANPLNGTVAGIVASGSRSFIGRTNASYPGAANLISVVQSTDKNKFLFVLTNGSASDVASKVPFLGDGKILSGVFGAMPRGSATSFPLYIVAEYDDIDIANNTGFSGAGQLLIRNWGPTPNGQMNITIERTG